MKNRIIVCFLVVILALSAVTVSAGDIPESVLNDETAQLFFGQVVSYQPSGDKPSITVSPVADIKGNITCGTAQSYAHPCAMGDFSIVKGKVYLCLYFENAEQIDLFEVTTYDTATLQLKHVEGSMWERFEEWINEGKYGHASIPGVTPYIVEIVYGSAAVVFCVGVVAGILVIRKKKKKQTVEE